MNLTQLISELKLNDFYTEFKIVNETPKIYWEWFDGEKNECDNIKLSNFLDVESFKKFLSEELDGIEIETKRFEDYITIRDVYCDLDSEEFPFVFNCFDSYGKKIGKYIVGDKSDIEEI